MIKYIFPLLFFVSTLNAQDFEGRIRYSITYESNDKSSEHLSKLKKYKSSDSVLVAYVKGKDFLKFSYKPNTIDIYNAKTNRVYSLEKDDKYIVVHDPVLNNVSKESTPKVVKSDSIEVINNIKCKKAIFDFGHYKSIVYYNDESKYNGLGKLFFYKSLIGTHIKQSFLSDFLIVKFVQEYKDVKSIASIVELENVTIDSSIYRVPKFEKSDEYDYDPRDKYQVYEIIDKSFKFPDLGHASN